MSESAHMAGMEAYEALVNAIGDAEALAGAVARLDSCDTTGQFAASAARFLSALDGELYATHVDALLRQAIDKDREKAYLPDLLPAIWGADYADRADSLRESDDNFRRIFKRVHPASPI